MLYTVISLGGGAVFDLYSFYTCMCGHVYVCLCASPCVQMWRLEVDPRYPVYLFLPFPLDWLTSELLGAWRLQVHAVVLIYMDAGDLSSVPRA